MSQPKTTLQKPKPDSAAPRNLSLCRYLPRSTPSMSVTATLTFCAGEARTASSAACGFGVVAIGALRRVERAGASAARPGRRGLDRVAAMEPRLPGDSMQDHAMSTGDPPGC